MSRLQHRARRFLGPLLVGVSVIGAAGCAYNAGWEEVQAEVSDRWVGQSIDGFILAYGPARGQTPLQAGGASYSWSLHRYDRYEADYAPEGDPACQVRIITDDSGEIVSAEVVKHPMRGYSHRIYCRRLLDDA